MLMIGRSHGCLQLHIYVYKGEVKVRTQDSVPAHVLRRGSQRQPQRLEGLSLSARHRPSLSASPTAAVATAAAACQKTTDLPQR